MVLSEARASVMADGERCEQQVVVVIIEFAEEGGQAVSHLRSAISHCASCGVRPHVVDILKGISLGISLEVDDALLVYL